MKRLKIKISTMRKKLGFIILATRLTKTVISHYTYNGHVYYSNASAAVQVKYSTVVIE